jgi:ABC-type nitrate/sulfonate/bicarbonate transport system permease component
MKLFNVFQLVTAFAIAPFVISWINEATFTGATIAFWVACIAYFVSYVFMMMCVYEGVDKC